MTRHNLLLVGFLIVLASILTAESAAGQIPVGNVEELYDAVDNPANAGQTLALAPGIYMLSATTPSGATRPNRGRLELQEDMSLVGVDGDRSAVVIDANNLPASSYTVPGFTGRVGAIRMGRGRTSIEWLTVRNARFGTSNIDTSLPSQGTTFVTVAHIESSGSQRGIDLVNLALLGASGRTIEADIIDNDLVNNAASTTLAQGIRMENVRTGPGTFINARMIGNRSWGSLSGRFMGNNLATNSTVNVLSVGNRFFGNSVGTAIFGGYSSMPTIQANGNTVNFEAHGDHFIDNTPPSTYVGGLMVVGGENAASTQNLVNNNTVNVALWGCRMSGNENFDIIGVGSRFTPASTGSPGMNNHVTIEFHGEGKAGGRWQPTEFYADVLPLDPATTNSVTVIR